jgi:hypothetical protein
MPETILREEGRARRWTIGREASLEARQTEALERLLALLEQGEPRLRRIPVPTGRGDEASLRRLTRLRAAHAAYALKTGCRARRTSPGAYILHHTRPH